MPGQAYSMFALASLRGITLLQVLAIQGFEINRREQQLRKTAAGHQIGDHFAGPGEQYLGADTAGYVRQLGLFITHDIDFFSKSFRRYPNSIL